ncbi:DDE-type integrase/transposase/recombinase [Streptomyces sioyaensis]|uniref:DDE-type integrase/transposase/recombinase n=1 Tax=Streptomyces sioyaensis TaxID=67364 RepID=UPI0033E80BD1
MGGFSLFATVIDCHTKAVVGWEMADHMKSSRIADALDMTTRNIDLIEGCIFHSDRGSQPRFKESSQQTTHFGATGISRPHRSVLG